MNNEKKDKRDSLGELAYKESKIIKIQPIMQYRKTEDIMFFAQNYLKSDMFPAIKSVAGFITVMKFAEENNLADTFALDNVAIVKGKLCLSAKVILAIAHKQAGVTWKIKKLDDDGCTMIFSRPGFEDMEVSFTSKEAEKAQLLGKDNWKYYRQDMLVARCSKRGSNRIAPDAGGGITSTEEMEDTKLVKPKYLKKAPPADVVEKQIFDEDEEVEVSDTGLSPQELEQVKEWQGDQKEEEKKDELKLKQQAWKEKKEKEIPPKESPATLDEPPDQELPFDDKAEIKKIGREIHLSISQLGITTAKQKGEFMQYLYNHQLAKKKEYLGKDDKGTLHFSLGKLEDLKSLYQILPTAVKVWKGEKNE